MLNLSCDDRPILLWDTIDDLDWLTREGMTTCMYFPFQHGAQLAGQYASPQLVFEAMLRVGGGIEAVESEEVTSYRGLASCRFCGAHNGSQEFTHGDMVVPSGALHYKEAHGIPLNLFSSPFNGRRLWYIAKSRLGRKELEQLKNKQAV